VAAAAGAGVASAKEGAAAAAQGDIMKVTPSPLFPISLAEWSLRGLLYKKTITNLDFPLYTKKTFGINAVEYVSGFFKNEVKDKKYLIDLKQRTAAEGITNVLIMVDGEGQVGADSEDGRLQTVERHKKWVEAAAILGCHSVRVNCHGKGSREDQAKQAADGLAKLSTFAADFGINIIVENHGGLSSDGNWMSGVLKAVNMPNCGSLPDFGNFKKYDRYQGIKDLMPYAKAVSAKCNNFDAKGNVTETDFYKAMQIVLDHGYRGWVGIEYGGGNRNAHDAIILTKNLLEKIGREYKPTK